MQVDNLIKILNLDGFKNIKVHNSFVSFEDTNGFRIFELSGDQLSDLRVILNIQKIMDSIYQEKTRFSENLNKIIQDSDDYNLEESFDELEWTILDVFDPLLKAQWTHDIDSDLIYIVAITGIKHIIVNNKVYTGEIDAINVLATTPIKNILQDTLLLKLLS